MTSSTPTASPIRLSLILPVYNVADYLHECLQSIIDQSTTLAIEALLIDDCSTDQSRAICSNFANRHPHLFKLIESAENRGVSVARNVGLDHAQGDYFTFVDPDDVLHVDALQHLHEAAVDRDVDIVKGNNTIFNAQREYQAGYNVGRDILVSGDAVLTTLYRHSRVRGHAWGKLYKRSRLGHLRYPVGVRMAQDLYYCGEAFSRARSLLLIDKPVYRYRLRQGGSTGRKYETGAYLDWLASVEKIGAFAQSPQQVSAHRGLLLRTMAQIARECRKVTPDAAASVLATIEQKCSDWNLHLAETLAGPGADIHSLGHYLKLQIALRHIRRKLAACR